VCIRIRRYSDIEIIKAIYLNNIQINKISNSIKLRSNLLKILENAQCEKEKEIIIDLLIEQNNIY
jgi:hypothetical protein